MDERDRQILALLQQDAWLSYVALGRLVHLSASAAQRRVERLKREGILLGAHANVLDEPERTGLRLYALVELADDRDATVTRFRRQIERHGMVTEAHYVTGEADVVLTFEAEDMGAYDAFVRRHFGGSPLVKRFKTFTSLRALKSPR